MEKAMDLDKEMGLDKEMNMDQNNIADSEAGQPEEATLEELFAQLDQTAARMEQEELSLEDTFALYRRGMDMLKECSDKIDRVEKKMLVLDEEGETYEF